ncbi:MAG: hydrogenase maturation nickel metallochaperone HypA [Nitrospinae bacterium RIFCSPLOWO2_12_FULL_45_22]|nr:MAG: hydrogenase maturation nickel metallochaperone HypA [Nitrospinae bacterium RIFCSPLOWO2_12_FULL_45_22]
MHELSIAQNILRIVEEEARKNKATRINSIKIKAGEMRGIVSKSLSFCFDFVSRGTLAEGARIDIEKIPIQGQCNQCQAIFLVENYQFSCPQCQSKEVNLTQGMELLVHEIETD